MKEIKLDLINNALDFIDSSLDPILNDDLEKLKYSILHLSAGIELLLKEKLREEHWSLIFEDISKANLSSFESGDFISVNFNTSVSRLENISEVQIQAKDLIYLRDLKKRRNRIEHFKLNENSNAIKSLTAKLLLFILEFLTNNFKVADFNSDTKSQIEKIREKANKFNEHTKLRYFKIMSELKEYDTSNFLPCPSCYQRTLQVDDSIKCNFCGYHEDPEKVAEDFLEQILRISKYREISTGGEFPLFYCSECGTHSLVLTDEFGLCFCCVKKYDRTSFDYCQNCGEFLSKDQLEDDICSDCHTDRWERFNKAYP